MTDIGSNSVLPLPGSVGALYEISSDEWQAINDQSAVVVDAQQIAQVIVQVIPNYPTLLPVCSKWQTQTYQSVVAQAGLVGTFGSTVAAGLGQIRASLASVGDADPLAEGQQFICKVQFESFATHAGTVESSVAALAPDIAAFVRENQTADVSLAKLASSLPPQWQSVAGPISDLQSGFAAVQDGWSSISAQLQALAAGTVSFTTGGQARAAIDAAVPAWNALNASAVAFDQHATNPTG